LPLDFFSTFSWKQFVSKLGDFISELSPEATKHFEFKANLFDEELSLVVQFVENSKAVFKQEVERPL
jgi:hypothetical protein